MVARGRGRSCWRILARERARKRGRELQCGASELVETVVATHSGWSQLLGIHGGKQNSSSAQQWR
uniref:Uncharacterized protein n=1 Tax=Arundo donax TaxID=35708 RepID=A0A0A9FI94_ARUDO